MSELLSIGVLQQQKNRPSGGGEVWDYETEMTVGNIFSVYLGYYDGLGGSVSVPYPGGEGSKAIIYNISEQAYEVSFYCSYGPCTGPPYMYPQKISINGTIIDTPYYGSLGNKSAAGLTNYFIEGNTVSVKIKYYIVE